MKDRAEYIYYEWDKALSENNVEALVNLYAKDAVIESPLIPYLLKKEDGACVGRDQIRNLVKVVAERKPNIRKYYRTPLLQQGNLIMWEYPRITPHGEQMDFVEVMELNDDGLIQYHRVYWGWKGFQILKKDAYYQ